MGYDFAGGICFGYPDTGRIWVWKEGGIYELGGIYGLNEAYSPGALERDDFQTIAYHYYKKMPPTLYNNMIKQEYDVRYISKDDFDSLFFFREGQDPVSWYEYLFKKPLEIDIEG